MPNSGDAVVLDTTAMLALINKEPGHETVEARMPGALLSAVNLAEVVGTLVDRGMPAERAQAVALALGPRIVEFDGALAEIAGTLQSKPEAKGLSLGDRCCLALGLHRKATVLTAERSWVAVGGALGVTVRDIRTPAG